jgi:hypothetical protein
VQCQIVGHTLLDKAGEQRMPGSRKVSDTGGVSANTGSDNVEEPTDRIGPAGPIASVQPHLAQQSCRRADRATAPN